MKYRRRFLGLLFAAALSAGAAVVPLSAAHAITSYYTMQLSPASATIQAGTRGESHRHGRAQQGDRAQGGAGHQGSRLQ